MSRFLSSFQTARALLLVAFCGLGGANKCDKLTAPRRKSQAIKLIEKYGSVTRIFIIFIAAQISIIP
jgi:hypothetical protein